MELCVVVCDTQRKGKKVQHAEEQAQEDVIIASLALWGQGSANTESMSTLKTLALSPTPLSGTGECAKTGSSHEEHS
jgi:hypothetical protein